MSYSDDDLGRELRRELQGNLVPFDPARAQYMIDEAIAASPVRRVLQSRWTLPLLASGAVAAVVGGVAGATALQSDGHPGSPGGGATVSVRPSTPPTVASTLPVPPTAAPTGPAKRPAESLPPSAPPTSVATTLPSTAPSTAPSPPSARPTPSKRPGPPSSTMPTPSGLVPMPGRG
jgi:hypothetical protein